ncbi:hypothetical protein Peur_017576 [Populus x canadensis]
MRKTFYYNFLPTKAEEDAVAARNVPYQVARAVVEIRDWYPAPRIDPGNPWQIRKSITSNEVGTTKLTLPHDDMFEHVFRFMNTGDEVGLFWDMRSGTFGFELLRRVKSIS